MRVKFVNKKFIAIAFASGIITQATCNIVPESQETNAAIIQPKLCYSDIWITDYEVVGTGRLESISGKYPYLEHRLDVYTDGTAKYYEYNNHEWDSYSYDPNCTVIFDGYSNTTTDRLIVPITEIKIELGGEIPNALRPYYEEKTSDYGHWAEIISPTPDDYFDAFDTVSLEDLSKMCSWSDVQRGSSLTRTFSRGYRISGSDVVYDTINDWEASRPCYYTYFKTSDYRNSSYMIEHLNSESHTESLVKDYHEVSVDSNRNTWNGDMSFIIGERTSYRYTWTGQLANLRSVDNSHPSYYYACIQYHEFIPTSDFSQGMSFSFGDHNIEVPASAFVSEDPIVNQESLEERVIALERENQELRESSSINNVKLDNHKTGYITASDAQDVLRYYCESIVGNESGSVDDYNDFIKRNTD